MEICVTFNLFLIGSQARVAAHPCTGAVYLHNWPNSLTFPLLIASVPLPRYLEFSYLKAATLSLLSYRNPNISIVRALLIKLFVTLP